MINIALDIWENKLKIPREKGKYSFEPIPGTNIILIKSFDNRLGLLIENTSAIPDNFKLKKFEFSFFNKLENKTKKVIYERCQLTLADKSLKANYLIKILFGIFEDSKESITSKKLMQVLKELKKDFDPEEEKRNEIIGVWGELYFLNNLFSKPISISTASCIINGWEGDGGRKKIDFRFGFCKIAIEVKTTTLEERIHHISGHEQFIKPADFNYLIFLSTRILPDDAGVNCLELVNKINKKLKNKSLITEFEDKILIRNNDLCHDTSYRFTQRDKEPFTFYDSKKFELPSIPKGVLKMHWEQNFDSVLPITKNNTKTLLTNMRIKV